MSAPRSRRVLLLGVLAAASLAGVLLVGYLPSRVDGGVEPTVRQVLAWLQGLGAPEWVNYDFADFLANIAFFIPIGMIAALLLPWKVWWLAIPTGAALSGLLRTRAVSVPARALCELDGCRGQHARCDHRSADRRRHPVDQDATVSPTARRAATSSANCTALSAAPLRRLSFEMKSARPRPPGTPSS